MSASSPASDASLISILTYACVAFAAGSICVWFVVFVVRARTLRQQQMRFAAEEELTGIVLDQLSGYGAGALKLNALSDWKRGMLLQVLQNLIEQTKGSDQSNLIRILHDAGFQATALEQVHQARSPEVRQNACSVLGYFEDQRSLGSLKAALDDPDSAVRLTACLALLRKDRVDSVAGLLHKLRFDPDDPPMVLAEIFRRLPARLHAEAIALVEAKTLPPEMLRMLALALARKQLFSAFDAITGLRRAPQARVRSAAWVALAELGDPGAADFLLEGLADPEPDVRHVAAQCAAKFGGPEVLPVLSRMTADGEWWDRYHAAAALAAHSPEGRAELAHLAIAAPAEDPIRQAWNDLPPGGADGR